MTAQIQPRAAVASTHYRRTETMTLGEARAIQAKTTLFGYRPDLCGYEGGFQLAVTSQADAKIVSAELKALRTPTPTI